MSAEKQIILETGRLMLREIVPEDYDALCETLKDPEAMYAYEHGFSDEEAKEWLTRQLRRYEENGFGLWAVIFKETGRLIGQCGITLQDAGGKILPEIGYLFARAYWHRGYAAEAALACRDYAFESLGAEEVCAIIREGNHASEQVAEKNSMTCTGTIVKHYYGMDMPHHVYKIARTEWQAQTAVEAVSYQKGVIDCFNEMVHAGLKRLAMSHPVRTKEERNSYLGFCNQICRRYGTFWYPEDEAFLTDLFPEELNRDTYVIIFYRVKEDLEAYLELKRQQAQLKAAGRYEGEARYRIAYEFGRLLSYTDEAIERKIRETMA